MRGRLPGINNEQEETTINAKFQEIEKALA